jgi:transcriptional regulator with XRE-family HTH domain
MSTNLSDGLWRKLTNKSYRSQFVSAQARRAFAFQVRAIMKKRGISQSELAKRSGLTQGVISRAADPNYGKLTITVIVKIANGLDMAYLGTLVPFSDAVRWVSTLSEESVQVKDFTEEQAEFHVDLGSALEATEEREKAKPATEEANETHFDLGRELGPMPSRMAVQIWSC